MTTKPKTRKPSARDKPADAHGHMNDGMNLLKMIEITADQLAHREATDEDLLFAICTASRAAVESIQEAYELVDKVSMGRLVSSKEEAAA